MGNGYSLTRRHWSWPWSWWWYEQFWDTFYQIFRLINKLFKRQEKKEKKIVKKIVNGYEILIDKNGKGIHRDLLLHSVREPISTKIIQEILKEGDVALEAGANVGYYTILESKRAGEKGLVYAVEPIKENFELLKRNVELNGLKNVKVYNLAFGDARRLNEAISSNEAFQVGGQFWQGGLNLVRYKNPEVSPI